MTIQFTQNHYQAQLTEKKQRLCALLAEFTPPEPQVFSSPIRHYRMRAEFRIWHEDDALYHIMFEPGSRQRIRVDQFPVASTLINQAMVLLLDYIKDKPELRHKLFQVDYLSTLSDELLITLLYHKQLTAQWQVQAAELRAHFEQQGITLQIVGRATKQKICLDNDYLEECLPVAGQSLYYRQVENSFTQPNAAVNIKMLTWALSVTEGSEGDLLELYCGNGNFSLALARHFRQVLATEIAKSSVAAAQYNIEKNAIDNVTILRMSAEEFTQALQGKRTFNRLKGVDFSIMAYHLDGFFI